MISLPFAARSRLGAACVAVFGLAFAACEGPDLIPYPELPDDIVFDCPIDCDDCAFPDACTPLGLTAPIAVGAEWTLDPRRLGVPVDVDLPEGVERSYEVSLAIGATDVLALHDVVDERFVLRALGRGTSAVVLHNGKGTVLDLVHVRTVVADALAIDVVDGAARTPVEAPLTLEVGRVVKLGVTPRAAGESLGGVATPTWTSSSADAVALTTSAADPSVVEIVGRVPGATTVRASFESVDVELEVVVR